MSRPTPVVPWIEYWYLALNSKHGIAVEATNLASLQNILHVARSKAKDPRLAGMILRTNPNNPNELWIMHNPSIADLKEALDV